MDSGRIQKRMPASERSVSVPDVPRNTDEISRRPVRRVRSALDLQRHVPATLESLELSQELLDGPEGSQQMTRQSRPEHQRTRVHSREGGSPDQDASTEGGDPVGELAERLTTQTSAARISDLGSVPQHQGHLLTVERMLAETAPWPHGVTEERSLTNEGVLYESDEITAADRPTRLSEDVNPANPVQVTGETATPSHPSQGDLLPAYQENIAPQRFLDDTVVEISGPLTPGDRYPERHASSRGARRRRHIRPLWSSRTMTVEEERSDGRVVEREMGSPEAHSPMRVGFRRRVKDWLKGIRWRR